MKRRALLLGIATLAGCSSVDNPLGPKASLSNASTELRESGSVITFEYSVDDFATVLLEDPNNEVVDRDTLEPSKTTATLDMPTPRAGTYRLLIRQGEDTLTERTVAFSGPDPTITEVTPEWNQNTLRAVDVTVRNTGDLPVRVDEITTDVDDQSLGSDSVLRWIDAGETKSLTGSSALEPVEITRPGPVRGEVQMITLHQTLTRSFQRTFTESNLEIVGISTDWQDASLVDASVTVQNTGDLPTTASGTLYHGEEVIAESPSRQSVPPGVSVEIPLSEPLAIFIAESSGTVSFSVVVDGDASSVEQFITHSVAPPDLSVQSVKPAS